MHVLGSLIVSIMRMNVTLACASGTVLVPLLVQPLSKGVGPACPWRMASRPPFLGACGACCSSR
eukprot:2196291-Pyramimonas_sp.AAC.1